MTTITPRPHFGCAWKQDLRNWDKIFKPSIRQLEVGIEYLICADEMLAKTGDVVVQKVPVIRLSVFLHFFFVFPFCLLHRLYMGMKQVQEFIMEPKGSVFVVRATLRVSLENAGKIFFNETE